mmetsp:Transcript_2357/g.6237  ORF Transcript_2357/g.6237 Transcript_2357/m.6237 type:complete len:214 (+) Transcript_2357:241-882(+)
MLRPLIRSATTTATTPSTVGTGRGRPPSCRRSRRSQVRSPFSTATQASPSSTGRRAATGEPSFASLRPTAGPRSATPRSTGTTCACCQMASASASTARTWATICPTARATATASTSSPSPATRRRSEAPPAEAHVQQAPHSLWPTRSRPRRWARLIRWRWACAVATRGEAFVMRDGARRWTRSARGASRGDDERSSRRTCLLPGRAAHATHRR